MPGVPFERYADDVICHCRTQREAEALRAALDERFAACGLVLHPQKTKIVYCKDTQPERTLSRGPVRLPRLYVPAEVRGVAQRDVRRLVPASSVASGAEGNPSSKSGAGRLQNRSDKALDDLARMFNPIHPRLDQLLQSLLQVGALSTSLRRIDFHLRKWVRRKFKRFRQTPKGAREWLARVIRTTPGLFAHWPLLYGQRPDAGSRMSREVHVRFWERAAVKLRRATRPG